MPDHWPIVAAEDVNKVMGPPGTCFYCQEPVGSPHGRECVTVTRTIRVRYSFELEVEVPHFWDKDEIEAHRNDSSWCASNAVDEMRKYAGGRCLCEIFEAQYLDEVTDA